LFYPYKKTPVTVRLTSTGAPIIIPKHRHYQRYLVVYSCMNYYNYLGEFVNLSYCWFNPSRCTMTLLYYPHNLLIFLLISFH